MYIGGWETRKNIPFLVRAFAEANLTDTKLVLAGGKYDEKAALIELTDSLQISNKTSGCLLQINFHCWWGLLAKIEFAGLWCPK